MEMWGTTKYTHVSVGTYCAKFCYLSEVLSQIVS